LRVRECVLIELEEKEKPFNVIKPKPNKQTNVFINRLKNFSKHIEGTDVFIREIKEY
jgi:hypothetical protein